MPYKFDHHDAYDLSRMIRRRRPNWNQDGIMRTLQAAAESGATISQVTAAAEKTWSNPKAQTPKAIMWPEHWEQDRQKPVSFERLCGECTRKHPTNEMTQEDGTWKCRECAA